MFTRICHIFLVLMCVVAFVACEGEQGTAGLTGPAGADGQDGQDGDNVILAFGDIDLNSTTATSSVLSSGPAGVVVSLLVNGTGDVTVTVTGTFPATEGTLIVSASSSFGVNNTTPNGEVTSWSTSQIVFNVLIRAIPTGTPAQDDFSFVILGQ